PRANRRAPRRRRGCPRYTIRRVHRIGPWSLARTPPQPGPRAVELTALLGNSRDRQPVGSRRYRVRRFSRGLLKVFDAKRKMLRRVKHSRPLDRIAVTELTPGGRADHRPVRDL